LQRGGNKAVDTSLIHIKSMLQGSFPDGRKTADSWLNGGVACDYLVTKWPRHARQGRHPIRSGLLAGAKLRYC
jgi:hypothetical protein